MRNTSWRCTFAIIATAMVAMISTGCKSGGWGMSSPSWMSLGKKKPPTSSIAGTREPLQPPSVSVPPYPASDPAKEAAMASASPRYPSPDGSLTGAGSSPYGAGSPESTGYGPLPGQTANAAGFATGPYSTGGAAAPTQQGFYSPTHGPGPAALTADARGGYQPGVEYAPSAASGYGSPGGFAAPSGYGQPSSLPAGTGHGMMDHGSATPYGTQQYPGTGSSFGAYPTTPGPAGSDAAGYGADPYAAVAPPDSGIPPYGNPASTNPAYSPSPYAPEPYGSQPFGYADGLGGYPTAPHPSGGAYDGYQTPRGGFEAPAPPVYGQPTTGSGYRPGSTGRGSDVLSPGGAAQPAGFGGSSTSTTAPSGGTYYPNTYSR